MGSVTISIAHIILVGIVIAIMMMLGGYSVYTKWGSLSKESIFKNIEKKLEKIKTQTDFSGVMKLNITMDINKLYGACLVDYAKDNSIQLTKEQIKKDKKYYELISNTINDICEGITMYSYIFDNDLYKYKEKTRWDKFKAKAIDRYDRKGKLLVDEFYDDTKVIMPLFEWGRRGGRDLGLLLHKHAGELLEELKTESELYNDYERGVG